MLCIAQAATPAVATAGATPGRGNRSVRMLAAYLDAGGSYRVEGESSDAKLELRSLRLESHVNLNNEFIEQKLAGQVWLLVALPHTAVLHPWALVIGLQGRLTALGRPGPEAERDGPRAGALQRRRHNG